MRCRLCLIECHEENEVPLFNNDEESNLSKLIAKYLYIEITQLDAFSTMMCQECVQHLNEFHKFFEYVELQQRVLQNEFLEIKCAIAEKPFISNPNFDSAQADLEHNDESMLDIKDVIIEEEICLDKTMSINEFGYADEHFDSIVQNDAEASEEDVPLQTLLSKSKRMLHKNKEVKKLRGKNMSCIQKTTKRKKRKLKAKDVIDETNIKEEDSIEEFVNIEDKIEKAKNYLTPEENKLRDEMVAKYVDLKCDICSARFESYEALKSHFRKEHNRKAYIICCNTRFIRRFLLLDHIQSHLNPDRFKCKLCDKVLKSQNNLNIHTKNMHAGRENFKHECSLCNKRFQHLSSLNHHMFVHKEERDHICQLCNKGFKSTVLLKVHTQHMHGERAIFVCETCGKEYRFKISFDRHVAEHQGSISDPTDTCPICGKWYTLKNLKNHLKRHELEESICEKCNKTFKSKSALATHIGYAHSNKTYNCTFCEKTFKRPSALREHIAMHTGRKDYNCAYCTREFRSKANMYSHIKKIHVEEWSMAQMTKYQCPNSEVKKEKTSNKP